MALKLSFDNVECPFRWEYSRDMDLELYIMRIESKINTPEIVQDLGTRRDIFQRSSMRDYREDMVFNSSGCMTGCNLTLKVICLVI